MYSPSISIQGAHPEFRTDIFIRRGSLGPIAAFAARDSRYFLITDQNVDPLYGNQIREACLASGARLDQFVCEPGESSKSWEWAGRIHAALAAASFPRDGFIIVLGGGVMGDLGGFVAATWMRGIRWVNCPTTMEAVLDSCIGGKTAINLSQGKNLVGALHHPCAVIIDPDVFCTLPARDIRAGLAEAIKHAALQGTGELDWLSTNAEQFLTLDADAIIELIKRNLRFKASIVQDDPDERVGRRIVLNFGHTIGHAIESTLGGRLRHGECVALGMIAEARIAERLNLLAAHEAKRLVEVISRFELPCSLESPIDVTKVWDAMRVDKKNTSSHARMVLLKGFGEPVVHDDVSCELVRAALSSMVHDSTQSRHE